MGQRQRWIVFIALIAAVTAACGAGAPSAVTSPAPSPAPSAATSPATATPTTSTPGGDTTATLTLEALVNADGPGLSVSDAIAYVGVEPLLVNGVLLKQADGTVWLCAVVLNSSVPRCAEPRLLVKNSALEDQTFVSGEGLHMVGGVRWVDHVQLFGVVRH
jgi:hypothetical protein